MEVLTVADIVEMTDIISSQGMSTTELRLFVLNQDQDVAKELISFMRSRHQIEILC